MKKITVANIMVANSFELNMLVEPQGKVELKKFADPEIIVKLGLFDIWVENTDRKYSFNIEHQIIRNNSN